MNNILITSIGKRVTLTRLFQQTAKYYFPSMKVYTTDMNPQLAPAGFVSDGCFCTPKVSEKNYINVLLELCITNCIRVIIPTIDTELLTLSKHKKEFQEKGIEPIVSDLDFVQICRDKRKIGEYLSEMNIRIPVSRDKFAPVFPMFAKPYDGSLSKDLYIINNERELTPEILNHPKLIFMEYIDKNDYKEFTVDMYYGRDHKVKSIVPRERLEIRAGEICKGYTRKNYLIDYLKERMNYLPGVIGCICIQLFYREYDNDVVGIEINPRFGGGYPLTFYAGANFPENILKEYFLNEPVVYSNSWLDETLMLRYDNEVIVYENGKNCCF